MEIMIIDMVPDKNGTYIFSGNITTKLLTFIMRWFSKW